MIERGRLTMPLAVILALAAVLTAALNHWAHESLNARVFWLLNILTWTVLVVAGTAIYSRMAKDSVPRSVMERLRAAGSGMSAQVDAIAEALEAEGELLRGQSENYISISDAATRLATQLHHIVEASDATSAALTGLGRELERLQELNAECRGVVEGLLGNDRQKVGEVSELQSRIEQMDEVVESVSQLADQTKLIAFNASIEAASAGEAGSRFDVVAREIRRMAESLAEYAALFHTRTTELNRGCEQMSAVGRDDLGRLQSGEAGLKEAGSVLKSLMDGVKLSADRLSKMADAARQQMDVEQSLSAPLKDAQRDLRSSEATISILRASVSEIGRIVKSLDIAAGGQKGQG